MTPWAQGRPAAAPSGAPGGAPRRGKAFGVLVASWLRGVPPAQLMQWVDTDASMIEEIGRSLPGGAALAPLAARAFLGPGQVAEAKAMTDDDFRSLLADLVLSAPAHGPILWAEESWYMREIRRMRDALVGKGA